MDLAFQEIIDLRKLHMQVTDSDGCCERRLKKPVGIWKEGDHFCPGTQEACRKGGHGHVAMEERAWQTKQTARAKGW